MSIEIKIKVKNDHNSYVANFYAARVVMDSSDPVLRGMIDSALKQFGEQEVDEVMVSAKMEV